MNSFVKLAIVFTFTIAASFLLYGEVRHSGKVNDTKFKYVIFSNTLHENKDIHYSRRVVSVFLDEKAFSEQSVRDLFLLLSNRFPSPQWLEVWVYTNLNQTETPEEADLPKSSNTPDNPELDRFHWAWIYSKNGNVFFRYNPNPPNRAMKTVIISGKDPYSGKE